MAELTNKQAFDLAVRHHEAGRLQEAETLYRQLLAANPNHAEAMQLLGVIAYQAGKLDIAAKLIERAIVLKPDLVKAYNNLGNVLADQGRIDDAIAAYRQAIALAPAYAEAFNNLGIALAARGQLADANAAYRRAIEIRPGYAEAYSNLCSALKDDGQFAEAIAAHRQAVALKPDFSQAYANLGNVLLDMGELDQSIEAFEKAIALGPGVAETYSNYGVTLARGGLLDDAITAFRRAVELKPSYFQAHSNLIYTLQYQPAIEAKQLLNEHLAWARVHAEPLKRLIRPHDNDRSAERRLKVGYVSPDFREHCQSFFTIPLLSQHDRDRFEIYCYSSVAKTDAVTDRIRDLVDQWRDVAGMGDELVAGRVREDGIDILVDLTMHMAGGRPLLFARKPAPVQMAWLAYPGTTGIDTMDYRLSDPYLDPAGGDESIYSEETLRLADCFWCYDPLSEEPKPNTLPAMSDRRFTFGCLNNFTKVNEGVLELWANVLTAVPNSDLLLLAPNGRARQRVIALLSAAGIEPSRIQFVPMQPRADYLRTFHRIDLCLDTQPYNGHTTSLDSFWMGVPVVTQVGSTVVGRAGWCQLCNLGLQELAAQTPQDFMRIAAELAADIPKLAALRAGLRERMLSSPLMDAPRFARSIESAYRQMWHTWCERVS